MIIGKTTILYAQHAFENISLTSLHNSLKAQIALLLLGNFCHLQQL